MHPLLLLVMMTIVLVGGFAIWSLTSTFRQQKYGKDVSGIGGRNDPLSGNTHIS
jgi:hypothetical protein